MNRHWWAFAIEEWNGRSDGKWINGDLTGKGGRRGMSGAIRTIGIIALFLASQLWASTGTIKGKVTDSESGEPVINANVVVLNTMWGAATDLDGIYTIIGVRPGVYDLEFSCVGYHPVKITQVVVQSDLTAEVNVKLTPAVLQQPEVVVVWKKPQVILDQSSTGTRLSKTDLQIRKPESISDILQTTKGFKTDVEGKWHVRGHRAG
ncbi:MAG: carboxypeptidase-like regulatory domain-containing protein, partial [bacterium]